MATILIVDDVAANRELLVTLLRYRGHRVREAADGGQALEAVRAELPDLVDLLVGDFVKACRGEGALPVSGEEGAQNVEWQLQIAECGVGNAE